MTAINDEQEKTLREAEAVEEMKETHGWKLLEGAILKALAEIDKRKASISRKTWHQDEKGITHTRTRSLQELGIEYVELDERAYAFRYLLATVDKFAKNAEQLRKKLDKSEDVKPAA